MTDTVSVCYLHYPLNFLMHSIQTQPIKRIISNHIIHIKPDIFSLVNDTIEPIELGSISYVKTPTTETLYRHLFFINIAGRQTE